MSSRWTYADLNLAAVVHRRGGRDRQLSLWYLLRNPAGVVHWPDVFAAGKSLHWSRRSLLKVLAGGEDIYWTFARSGLYLHGTARVAAGLGITQIRVKVPLRPSYLRGPLAVVRARLGICAIAALRQGLPIANATTCAILHISRPTLKRWERLAKVGVIPNVVLIAPLRKSTPTEFWQATGERGLLAIRYRRRPWMARQLPNSYRSVRGVQGRRSLRYVNRAIPVPERERASPLIRPRGAVLYAAPELPQPYAGPLPRTQNTRPPRYTFIGETRKPGVVRLWQVSSPEPEPQQILSHSATRGAPPPVVASLPPEGGTAGKDWGTFCARGVATNQGGERGG